MNTLSRILCLTICQMIGMRCVLYSVYHFKSTRWIIPTLSETELIGITSSSQCSFHHQLTHLYLQINAWVLAAPLLNTQHMADSVFVQLGDHGLVIQIIQKQTPADQYWLMTSCMILLSISSQMRQKAYMV